MADYKHFARLNNRYDLNLPQSSGERIRFDSIADLRYEQCLIQHDLKPLQFYRAATVLDSDSYSGFLLINGLLDIRGMQFETMPQVIDAFSYRGSAAFRFDWDFLIWQKNGIVQTCDVIDLWPSPRQTGFAWQHDLIVAVRERHGGLFDSLLVLNPTARLAFDFDILKLYRERIPIRWDSIPCDFLARLNIRFNSHRIEKAALPLVHQSLVRPGWRISARNIDSNNILELGFIDADHADHSLNDISLPDGQYEISVLTSSLFWKDVADHQARIITVGADEEITPLPTIFNLRSSVQLGTTTIQWSATHSDLEDCVFGVWFSAASPVPTDGPPDATIWYSSSMTEYQTSIEQREPAWVAVTAIRPGNDAAKGKVHELFLDWSSVPPRAPDDVVILAEPLPVFDADVLDRIVEEEDLALVF